MKTQKFRKLFYESLEARNLLASLTDPQAIPYVQDFSVLPIQGWEYNFTEEGRIRIYDGRLRMDDTTGNNTYSQNEAILHLNLLGAKNVELTGYHKNLKDETHSGDGIAVSNDGITWTKITAFDVTNTGVFAVDLDSIGVPFSDDFRIKLMQFDNYYASYDGREWDDISVEEIIPPTPQTLPYTQDFITKPNRSEGWEYVSTNEGRIKVVDGRLRMDDVTGNTTYSQNYAILRLEPTSNAQLTGNHWNLSDETHSGDGISTSNDGVTWVDAQINLSSGSFSVVLPPGATHVRFEQYDNYSANSDGREWDNLLIEELVPPTPQMLPYTQDFVGLPGRAEGWEYISTNEGRIQVVHLFTE